MSTPPTLTRPTQSASASTTAAPWFGAESRRGSARTIPYDGTTLRWYDAAEGKDIVTVIGNAGAIAKPLLATLAGNSAPDAGNVRAAFRPASDDYTIFLNGIANVPAPASTSSICGEFDGAAWHIAIDDAVNILWQKKYNHGGLFA